MIHRIQSYIQRYNLCNSGAPILVACSGGVDSMVLADVMLKLHYKIAIAHCNFQLRDKDSDNDEEFVTNFSAAHKIEFHSIKFDTGKFKKEKSISTQMAARELRYEWFENIRKENGYHTIATAHHLDDQLETVLLNFAKGTGIKGLTGMQPKNGFVVRPLLEISKDEILAYARENNISYREDASNDSDDYQRNLLRHQVVPPLHQINPSLYNTAISFIERMNDYEVLTKERIAALKKKCYSEKNGIIEIKMGFIAAHPAGKTILFHLLNEFGFNTDQVEQLMMRWHHSTTKKETETKSGANFFSETHRVAIDRNSIFIVAKNIERENYLELDKIPHRILFNNYKIDCSVVPVHELNVKTSPRYAYLDLEKLQLPLLVRYYKEGDYFYPFGMSKPKTPGKVGKKKLSKYFKDDKFPQTEKENTAVLFSGEKLAWLIGHRIDDRFKVTVSTKNVLKLVLLAD